MTFVPDIFYQNSCKFDFKNFKLAYIKQGEGYPVLLLHGANIGSIQWYKNVPELRKRFTLYALDFPGAGFSFFSNPSLLEVADYYTSAEAFIKKVIKKKPLVIGHSFGGWIGYVLAKKDLVSKLLLVNPMGLTRHIPFPQNLVSINPICNILIKRMSSKEYIRKFLEDGFYDQKKLESWLVDFYFETLSFNNNHPLRFMNSLSNFFKVRREIMIDSMPKIPSLLIHGRDDNLIKMTKIMPNVNRLELNHEILYNAGHVPFIELHQQFNSLALSFLLK